MGAFRTGLGVFGADDQTFMRISLLLFCFGFLYTLDTIPTYPMGVFLYDRIIKGIEMRNKAKMALQL